MVPVNWSELKVWLSCRERLDNPGLPITVFEVDPVYYEYSSSNNHSRRQ